MVRTTSIIRDNILVYQHHDVSLTLVVGTLAWDAWLIDATSFIVEHEHARFIARKERAGNRRGGWYWRAYHKHKGILYRRYIGKAEELTLARLNEVAYVFSQLHQQNKSTEERVTFKYTNSESRTKSSLEYTFPHTQWRLQNTSLDCNALLSTKWSIPPARTSILPRQRLYERLQEIKRYRLTLISAPIGSGKTTLLSEWYAASRGDADPLPVAWLSLDEDDNDPVRFWTYFISAVKTLQNDRGEDALALLYSSRPSPIKSILTLFINDIAAIPYDYALILDDYHYITIQSIHSTVEFLLDHLPPNLHLVIATRSDPPFSLARRRADAQLNELRVTDLCFTSYETTTFLNERMQLHLPEDMLATLEARIEGWAAGLQLAVLSLRECKDISSFVADFTGDYHYFVDYLVEEVLHRQSEEVQNFLLQTCIVERLDASLCDALTNGTHSQNMLMWLERANLFIIPLDDARKWYRYHSLFADMLRTRLRMLHPDWIPELHLKASQWYEDHAFLSDAIDHALAASAFERAATLIEVVAQTTTTIWVQRQFRTLQKWLDKLPQTLLHTRTQLCILHAWMLFSRVILEPVSELTAVEACLHNAECRLPLLEEGSEREIMLGEIVVISACTSLLKGEISRATSFAQQALALLPQENTTLREVAARTLVNTYTLCGDIAIADHALSELLSIYHRTNDIYVSLNALYHIAQLQTMRGDLHRAFTTYHEMLRLAEQKLKHLIPAPVYIELGSIWLEWNDIDAASNFLLKGIEHGKNDGDPGVLIYGYTVLARLKQIQGKKNEAFNAIEEAEYVIQKYRFLSQNTIGNTLKNTLELSRAWLSLLQGNIDATNHWAQTSRSREDEPFTSPRFRELSMQVRLHLANKDVEEASKLIMSLLQMKENVPYLEDTISLLSLQALTFSAQGKLDQALIILARALSLAEPGGYVRIFLNEGRPLAVLLECLFEAQKGRFPLTKNVSQNYICRLLAAFGIAPIQRTSVHKKRTGQAKIPAFAVSLSEREREVLQLMGTGLSDREIAERLVLAEGTIKTHAKRIYTKLGVSNRMQAVLRARELHIL